MILNLLLLLNVGALVSYANSTAKYIYPCSNQPWVKYGKLPVEKGVLYGLGISFRMANYEKQKLTAITNAYSMIARQIYSAVEARTYWHKYSYHSAHFKTRRKYIDDVRSISGELVLYGARIAGICEDLKSHRYYVLVKMQLTPKVRNLLKASIRTALLERGVSSDVISFISQAIDDL